MREREGRGRWSGVQEREREVRVENARTHGENGGEGRMDDKNEITWLKIYCINHINVVEMGGMSRLVEKGARTG
jgi:hypothetical protein